jgi:hypothetical protein
VWKGINTQNHHRGLVAIVNFFTLALPARFSAVYVLLRVEFDDGETYFPVVWRLLCPRILFACRFVCRVVVVCMCGCCGFVWCRGDGSACELGLLTCGRFDRVQMATRCFVVFLRWRVNLVLVFGLVIVESLSGRIVGWLASWRRCVLTKQVRGAYIRTRRRAQTCHRLRSALSPYQQWIE